MAASSMKRALGRWLGRIKESAVVRIRCPHCGLRSHAEFSYGGDARRQRPAESNADAAVWSDHVFLRDNPRDVHEEYWQHTHGCRVWLQVTRNTATHAISAVSIAADKSESPCNEDEQ